jgi:hypothetical protein
MIIIFIDRRGKSHESKNSEEAATIMCLRVAHIRSRRFCCLAQVSLIFGGLAHPGIHAMKDIG